ncbi:TPA: hypothetical protein ACX6SG_002089 [Photobacterium damselae]
MKLFLGIVLLLICVPIKASVLNANITGNKISYRNITNSISGDKVITSWIPVKNLLPAKSWSPGFIFNPTNVSLSGPGGNINISNAIKVIGLEYRSNDSLNTVDNMNMPGSECGRYGHTGTDVYVISNSSTMCHSKSVFSSNSRMPFHFIRPILDINESDIISSFESLSNKAEGFYSGNVVVNYVYAYEQLNGVITWRNMRENINISFYYKPNIITSISLDDPNIHNMVIMESSDPSKITGTTVFNITAKGYFNNGIGLKLVETNRYKLFDVKSRHTIDFSVFCPNCNDSTLVDKGAVKTNETVISGLKGEEIHFPIEVKFEEDKVSIPIGEYYGQFTILFTADI